MIHRKVGIGRIIILLWKEVREDILVERGA